MPLPAETLLLQVDIQANNTRLVELQKQLNETKAANVALNQSFKDGKVTTDELAAGQVRLRQTAADISQETRILTKANRDQEAATKASTGSIEQLRAQLASGTADYNALSAAERDTTDAGQKLQATNKATSDQLKVLEGAIGDTRRNVGNYAGSIGPLIQELVKLQEQQKKIPEGTAAYQQAQAKVIGFQQAVNDAGIKAGLTYDQTQAKIAGYGTAIQPVTAKLVALENEQKKVGEGSKEYAKIGFQIGALKKEIEKVPIENKKLGDSLADIDGKTNVFGGHVGTLKQQFSQAKQGIELAKDGFTGLKGAIASTGIGVFILALGALVTYFKQSDEGQETLAAGLAALKAVFSVLEGVVVSAGKGLSLLFTDPKKAAADFVSFLEENVTNRLKAFGVIFRAIKQGDFKGATNGVLQLGTGVENVIGKAQALGTEFKRVGNLAAALSRAKDQLEDQEIAAIALNEKQKQQAERLVLTAKDRNLTERQRLANLDEAGRLETAVLNRTVGIERERLRILSAENVERSRTGKLQDDQRRAEAEQQAKLFQLQGEFETNQQKIENRRSVLQQATAGVAKADAANAEALRKRRDDARLKEIEADIEATKAREEAAVKQLDGEDKARALAAQREEGARIAQKNANMAAYKADLDMLTRNLEQRRVALETAYAAGQIDKKQYEGRLSVIEEGGLAARLLLAKHYNQDVNAADIARTRFHNAQLEKQTAKQQAEYQQQSAAAAAFGQNVGSLFAQTLNDTGASLQDFAAKVLILVLDSLEKATLAAVAEATIKSIGSNPTPAGFIQAALSAAAITAAFETVKAALAPAPKKQFHDGGLLSGPSHAGGGIPFAVGGRIGFEAEGGEAIMSKGAVQQFAPLLSHLNYMGGGRHFAAGGIPGQVTPRSYDGGLAARTAGAALPTLDYPTLIKAIADYGKFDVGVTALRKAEGRYDRGRSLSTLGG